MVTFVWLQLIDTIFTVFTASARRFLVRVSYMEIYNEEVRDLLGKEIGKSLEVKERADIGVYVKDLSGYVVHNADDLDNIMKLGNKKRKWRL